MNFLLRERYEVPEVIRAIGRDESTQVIRSSTGLHVSELAQRDLIGARTEQIMMQWGMEPSAANGAGRLTAEADGEVLELTYGGAVRVNGAVVSTDYARLDGPYGKAPREPHAIELSWGGHALLLDYENLIREVR